MGLPIRTGYLGLLSADPPLATLVAGQWWFNTSEGVFKFFNGVELAPLGGTYQKLVRTPADEFGRPFTNPPNVVDQDNLTLYSFTVNTDQMTYKFPIPTDYDQEGGFTFLILWTNDGGVDDNGKNVKWQLSYQVGAEGDVISGSHANSPRTTEDTYTSDLGWVEHHSDVITIPHDDFAGKYCLFLKIMAVTPAGTPLTCEPHLIGMCILYQAKRFVV